MSCTKCRGWMKCFHSYECFEPVGRLSLTAWLCGTCGSVKEEILDSSRRETRKPRRFRYAVAV